MKKFLLLFALVPLLMGMKVVYQNDSGKIDAIGPFANYKTVDGQSIVDVPEADPDDLPFFIVKNGKYVKKSASELQTDLDVKQAEKNARVTAKKSLLAKLGINKTEFNTLLALIDDRTDE
jgi:hypothetical protein